MAQISSEGVFSLPSQSAGSQGGSCRLPYRPPYLTTLPVNSHTATKLSLTPSEWHGSGSTNGNTS